ncbi:MAG: hypothetical protein Q4A75_09520, partial [Peptostreptococcaceae bacterium]|nr:hypothetical protein [Peptostreptococcaceae bacterium]
YEGDRNSYNKRGDILGQKRRITQDNDKAKRMLKNKTEDELWEISRNCQDPNQRDAAVALNIKYTAESKRAAIIQKVWEGIYGGTVWGAQHIHWVPVAGLSYSIGEGLYVTATGDIETYNFNDLSADAYYRNWQKRQGIAIGSTAAAAAGAYHLGLTGTEPVIVVAGELLSKLPGEPTPSEEEAPEDPRLKEGFSTGAEAEEYMREVTLKGKAVPHGMKTSLGMRYLDGLDNNRIAHEAKTGYVTFRYELERQILKDAELFREGYVEGVVWHFYRSAYAKANGKPDIGAHDNVILFLMENKIEYIIHG